LISATTCISNDKKEHTLKVSVLTVCLELLLYEYASLQNSIECLVLLARIDVVERILKFDQQYTLLDKLDNININNDISKILGAPATQYHVCIHIHGSQHSPSR